MIKIHNAILALHPESAIINGNSIEELEAFDETGNKIQFDIVAVQAKAIELQAAQQATQQAAEATKQSAMDKLAKLGLTEAEIKALTGA